MDKMTPLRHNREIIIPGNLNGRTTRMINSNIEEPFVEEIVNENRERLNDDLPKGDLQYRLYIQ